MRVHEFVYIRFYFVVFFASPRLGALSRRAARNAKPNLMAKAAPPVSDRVDRRNRQVQGSRGLDAAAETVAALTEAKRLLDAGVGSDLQRFSVLSGLCSANHWALRMEPPLALSRHPQLGWPKCMAVVSLSSRRSGQDRHSA